MKWSLNNKKYDESPLKWIVNYRKINKSNPEKKCVQL